MTKKHKIKHLSSEELNRMANKGVGKAIVRQPIFKMRVLEHKNRTKPVRKMKHKGRAYE